MKVVVKIGSSSLTDEHGQLLDEAFRSLAGDIAVLRGQGHEVILVSSGAVAAGLGALQLHDRPSDVGALQALASVGQPALMREWVEAFADHNLCVGQVLMTAADFGHRKQYLHARETLARLGSYGVVPVVNENDTIASEELRFGDNDRIAALVANMTEATLLVLLTDTDGLFTADPRLDHEASLIEEVIEVDEALESLAGGAGTNRGSGGMATKLAAAKIAAWSGVRTVIARANANSLVGAVEGAAVGTVVSARSERLPARKLWIAFACPSVGHVTIDDGAVRAVTNDGRSLLAAGVVSVSGTFDEEDAIEVKTVDGVVVAKGISQLSAEELQGFLAARGGEGAPSSLLVVHRDDMVVLEK